MASMALDLLLSWGKAEAKKEANELAAHVMQGWDKEKVREEVCELVVSAQSVEQKCLALSLLSDAITSSSDTALISKGPKWCSTLTQVLRSGGVGVTSVGVACTAVSKLVTRFHGSHTATKDIATQSLPSLLPPLVSLAQATPELQLSALPTIAHFLVYFPSIASAHKTALKIVGHRGMFDHNNLLARECCRLLVLLTHRNPTHWNELFSDLLSCLDHVISLIYQPVTGSVTPTFTSSLELPLLPSEEPARSSVFTNTIAGLSRAVCYALSFPPSSPVSVPLEKTLEVVFHGVSLHHQQVQSSTTEVLLLVGLLPTIHTAMWNILSALINSCHTHLFPYTAIIEHALLKALGSAHSLHCSKLLVTLHRVLKEWVGVRKDCDQPIIVPMLRWLMEEGRGDDGRGEGEEGKEDEPKAKRKKKVTQSHTTSQQLVSEVQLSSLNTLVAMVTHLGPILPSLSAEHLCWFPLDLLSHQPPPLLAESALRLLLACSSSSNPSLTPPLNATIRTFTAFSTHSSLEVRQVCQEALRMCSLIQHPSTFSPLIPLTHTRTTLHQTAGAEQEVGGDSTQPMEVTTFQPVQSLDQGLASSRSSINKTRPSTTETRPSITETRPSIAETRPSIAETRSTVTGTRPSTSSLSVNEPQSEPGTSTSPVVSSPRRNEEEREREQESVAMEETREGEREGEGGLDSILSSPQLPSREEEKEEEEEGRVVFEREEDSDSRHSSDLELLAQFVDCPPDTDQSDYS